MAVLVSKKTLIVPLHEAYPTCLKNLQSFPWLSPLNCFMTQRCAADKRCMTTFVPRIESIFAVFSAVKLIIIHWNHPVTREDFGCRVWREEGNPTIIQMNPVQLKKFLQVGDIVELPRMSS